MIDSFLVDPQHNIVSQPTSSTGGLDESSRLDMTIAPIAASLRPPTVLHVVLIIPRRSSDELGS